MIDLLNPPAPEVTPAVRDRILARVEAGIATEPPRRSWPAPAAAAAAVVLLAAGAALITHRHHDGAADGPTRPTDQQVVQECGLPDSRLLVRSNDDYGGVAIVGNADDYLLCVLDADGSVSPQQPRSRADSLPFENQPSALAWGGAEVAPAGSPGGSCYISVIGLPSGLTAVNMPVPPTINATAPGVNLPRASSDSWPTTRCVSGFQAWGTAPTNATHVTVTFGSYGTVDVPSADGVFAARLFNPAVDLPGHGNPAAFTMRAYGADGALISQTTQPF